MDKIDYKKVSASLVAIALALVVYIADDMRDKINMLPEMQKDLALMNQQVENDRKVIKRVINNIQSDLDELKDQKSFYIADKPAWHFLSPETLQAVVPPFISEES